MAEKDRRLFIRLDIDYPDHPKIVGLSDRAFRAHVEMMAYARKYATDGVIPNRVANRLGYESVSELLQNDPEAPSLIDNGDGTYLLHGYADMNETRADIEERKARNHANGRRGGRPKKTQSVTESDTQSVPQSQTHSGTQRKAEIEIEIEIDNSLPKGRESTTSRGARLSKDWMPSQETIDKMRADAPNVDVRAEHEAFVDYWIALPGQKGVKKDWDATWRNWMRRKQGDHANKRTRQAPAERAAQTTNLGRTLATDLLELE
ncbi:hypothetical protein [Mycetocola reblochoni]|uniref:hypothetical protein n=1 Tax=Mycetocola reblochoni TaxID=331618 RepID=UPI00117EB709|nr:hypothetical protein [Mycetocola reblochoni]